MITGQNIYHDEELIGVTQLTCVYIYTTVEKFWISKTCDVFKEVSYAHLGCIYLIKNTEKKQ